MMKEEEAGKAIETFLREWADLMDPICVADQLAALDELSTLREKLRGLEEERDEARANWTEEAAQVEWQARRAEGAEQKLRAAEEALERIVHFERTVDDEGDDITAGRMRYIARTALSQKETTPE